MISYLLLASGLMAYTFGYSEMKCGEIHKPVACSHGAKTASGEEFDPKNIASAAIPLPKNIRMIPVTVKLRIQGGECAEIRVNDKAPEKWLGKRGFELTPAALKKLGVTPSKSWSGIVEVCE
jgi:hypothetical protein